MPDEAMPVLLACAFSGAIDSPKGKGVGYALIEATFTTFSWSAAIEDIDGPAIPNDRHLNKINRQSKEIYPPKPIVFPKTELTEAFFRSARSSFGLVNKIHQWLSGDFVRGNYKVPTGLVRSTGG